MGFIQKFKVQKGRTVTCLQGVVHEGGILSLASFSGDDDEVKKKKIAAIVESKAMLPIPLTDAEKEALAESKKKDEARVKKEAADKVAADKVAAEKTKTEDEARVKKEAAILSADFDSMNKDPMIQFAEDWGIELQETKADDIRAELNLLKESLKSL